MVVDLRHPRRATLLDLVPLGQLIADVEYSTLQGDAFLSAFDYDALPPHVQTIAKAAANKIRIIRKKQLEGILEIGNVLNSMKKTLAHGSYHDWVREELELEPRTAQNYAMAAEVFYGKSETVSHLKMTKIYALSRAAVRQIVPSDPGHLPKKVSSLPVQRPEGVSSLVDFLVTAAGLDLSTLLNLLKVSGYRDLATAVDAEEKRRNKRPTKTKAASSMPRRSGPKV